MRRALNLFEGQLLNFDIIEEHGAWEIRVFAGSFPRVEEMAAFKEAGARKKRRERAQKCGTKFGKSDMKALKKALKIIESFGQEEG